MANSWLMTWIPTACIIGLIVSALAWMFHMLRLDWAVRLCVGMIVIGSASYIVGWFFG
jgi:type IV secretory pathway VirB2 component (pilin)